MNSTRRLRYLIDIIVIALGYFGLDAAADAFPLRDFRIVIVVSTLAKCVFLVFIWFWLLMRGDTVGTIGLKKPRNWLFSILAGRGGPCSFAELCQRFYVILSKEYLLLSKTKRRPPDANTCRPNQTGAAKKRSADPLLCYLRRGVTALLPIRATKSGSRDRKICETTRV